MRKILLAAFTFILFAACDKDNNKQTFQAEGTLIRFDPSQCPTVCCGGIFLAIDNDPVQYKIQGLPNVEWHDLITISLPRRISFDYQSYGHGCASQVQPIIITNYVLH